MSNIIRLHDYFEKIYCVNLNRRPDRWQQMQAVFKKEMINAERFQAVDGNPMGWSNENYTCKPNAFRGAMGCIASHLNIYKQAKELNLRNVLIIEDDCDFIDNINVNFTSKIKEVPEDWDLLYFGGMHETRGGEFVPEVLTGNVVRAKRIITTTCYAVKNTVYDLIIDTLEKELPKPYTAIDGYLGAVIQPQCKTYAFHPPLAWQRASYSDIQNGMRDYANLMRYNNIR